MRADNLNWRQTACGILVGIHNALAPVVPFMKRGTEGFREPKASRNRWKKLTRSDW
jgi:hypothetical protein